MKSTIKFLTAEKIEINGDFSDLPSKEVIEAIQKHLQELGAGVSQPSGAWLHNAIASVRAGDAEIEIGQDIDLSELTRLDETDVIISGSVRYYKAFSGSDEIEQHDEMSAYLEEIGAENASREDGSLSFIIRA